MKIKTEIKLMVVFAVIFAISSMAFAQTSGKYVFSGFGGGMPASAVKADSIARLQFSGADDYTVIDNTIIEAREAVGVAKSEATAEVEEELPSKTKNSKTKKASTGTMSKGWKIFWITTGVVVGTAVIGGGIYLAVVGIANASNDFMNSCTKTCGEGCSGAFNEMCSNMNCGDSLRSSLGSACSKKTIVDVFTSGFALMPVFVP